MLVARVTGKPLEAFLRERVLDPLGMKDTGFHVPADRIDRLPPLYGPDPLTGRFVVWDEAAGGRASRPPVFQGAGGGLVSTVYDYHAYFRMLLNKGTHGSERILSRPAVELMTTDRLTAELRAARDAMYGNIVHLTVGQGPHGGWGFGMAVRTRHGGYAPVTAGTHPSRRVRTGRTVRLGRRHRHHRLRRPGQPAHRSPAHQVGMSTPD